MLRSIKFASATLVAALLAVPSYSQTAQAAVIITGNSLGTFGMPNIDENIDPDAMFSIERPAPLTETFTLGEAGEGSTANKLTFAGRSFAAMSDRSFSIGTLTYLNGQTFSGTNASSVPLGVNINLLQPAQTQQQFEYRFTFNLTSNTNNSNSADSLSISQNPAPQTFTISQQTYSVEVLGFSPDNGATFTRSFQVPEDQAVDSTLFARIRSAAIDEGLGGPQPTDVPEPTLALGLATMAGAMLARQHQSLNR